MRYFEITEPHYALLQTKGYYEALVLYTSDVIEPDDFEVTENSIKEVPEYYAAAHFARSKGECGTMQEMNRVIEILETEEDKVLLISGELL